MRPAPRYAALLALAAGACTTVKIVESPAPPEDRDAGVVLDAGPRDAATGSDGRLGFPEQCPPPFVPGPTTPAYHPYRHDPACTDGQLASFYAQCVDEAATQTTCGAWENDANNAPCEACLVTPASDATWGPIVRVANRDLPFNVAGCFGLALGEGADVNGCGAARWALDRCLQAACRVDVPQWCLDGSEGDGHEDCLTRAAYGACASARQIYETKCAALLANAGDASASVQPACPLADGTSPQDFTLAITRAFCGGAGRDAGSD